MALIIRKNTNKGRHSILPGFPFKSNYVYLDGIRIHYIDEGETEQPTLLFLHGVPTWSYTFRNIIPACLENGFRVIAPDLPGFGKSDKPGKYSLQKMVNWMEEFIWKVELKNLFLFAHDWGAIIGMILAAKNPAQFSGIMVCNGYLPVIGQKQPALFRFWKFFVKYSPVIPVGLIVSFACMRNLSKAERASYNFPFENKKEKRAIRILPQIIPTKKSDRGAKLVTESWKILRRWEKPFLTVFSDKDPITRGGDKILHSLIPGTQNKPHRILEGKHFVQEDSPNELSYIIIEFVNENR